ncbi:hypothetical protein Acr_01g0000920 [Actinidia rufa]|uniref:RNase H type-1 domain-containing protein n=1 Tax=Actinidia rufa TaxID=165716 RepID=A0A7J0E1A0_9ERIC|nr:hypothetical protein Acr_01g0000920 [Actinidia rufa]
MCEEEEENVQHVLMGCWFAEKARNLGLGNGVLKIRYARFKNWVRAILIQNDQVIGCCFALLAWAIWNAFGHMGTSYKGNLQDKKVDGSTDVKNNCSGTGIVILEWGDSNWCFNSEDYLVSPKVIELIAVRRGSEFAAEFGLQRIVMEGDAMGVVKSFEF